MTSAIVGVRKPDHITGVLPAIDVTLDEAALAEIREIAK
jgi:aryl-alcohol dehydrogenase-like predicted oxidoreductase